MSDYNFSSINKFIKRLLILGSDDLYFYRTILVLGSVVIPSFYFVEPAAEFENPVFRALMVLSFVALFVLSFFLGWVKKNIGVLLNYLIVFPMVIWGNYLLICSKNDPQQFAVYLIILVGGALSLRSYKRILPFFLIIFSFLVFNLFWVSEPLTNYVIFVSSQLVCFVFLFYSYGFHLNKELDLKKSSDLLKEILNESPDAFLLLSEDYKSLFNNNEDALTLFNVPSKEGLMELFSNSGFFKDIESNRFFKKITLPNGDVFWGDTICKPILIDDKKRIIVRIVDVTSQKKAEESMKLSESILNQIDNLILVANENAEITFISPCVKQILGYDPEELLGQKWWDLPRDESYNSAKEKNYVLSSSKGKSAIREEPYEVRYISKSGKNVWILWKDNIVEGGLVVGVGYNITKNKKESMVKDTLFKMAEASVKYDSLKDLFWFIEREIRNVFQSKNLIIAFYKENETPLSFPLFIDERLSEKEITFIKKDNKKGLTEFLIENEVSGVFSKKELNLLLEKNNVPLIGSLPEVYMCSLLRHENKPFALISIQNYDNVDSFSKEDFVLLQLISGQLEGVLARKKATQDLKEREERLRVISEATFEGLVIHQENKIILVNSAFKRLFKVSNGRYDGKSLDLCFLPESRPILREAIKNPNKGPFYLKTKNELGETMVIEGVVATHIHDNNQVFISAFRDISERLKLEAAEKSNQSNAILSLLIQNISDFILVLNEENVITYCSLTVKKILGFEPNDLIGTSISELFSLESNGPLEPYLNEIRKTNGKETLKEFSVSNIDNQQVHLRSHFVHLEPNPFINGVLINSIDITEQKRNELILQESEEKYRTLVETMSEGILIVNQNDEIIHVNQRFCQMVGYSYPELVHPDGYQLIFKDPLTRQFTINKTALRKKGVADSYEIKLTSKQGEFLWVLISGSPYLDSEGTFLGTIGVVTDITKLKRAEKALSENEEKFRLLFSEANDAIFILKDGEIVDCNKKSVGIFFYPQKEIIGKTPVFFSPEYQPNGQLSKIALEYHINNAVSGKTENFYWKHQRKDGSLFDAEVTLTRFKIKGGIFVQGFIRDITIRLSAERALRESEEKKEAILQAVPDLIFVFNSDGIFLDFKGPRNKLFVPPESFMGQNYRDVMPPPVSSKMSSAFDQLGVSGNIVESFDYQLENGEEILDYEARITRSGSNEFLSLIRDITSRKKTERALIDSETKNVAILNAIPDLMFLVNSEGYIKDFKVHNPNDLYSSPSMIQNSHMSDYLSPDHVTQWMKYIKLALETEETVMYEYEMQVKSGLEHFESRLIKTNNTEVLTMVRNVSERKIAEKELLQRNFELDSFVYKSSHDLKAPLNSIMGLINLSEMEKPKAEVENYLSLIKKSVYKLEGFINDLTDFSRNKSVQVDHSPVDFKLVLDDIITNLQFMEYADRVEIIQEINQSHEFKSDLLRLNIILTNLLSNGIKYQNLSHDNNFIKVVIDCDEKEANITIQDNGVGISEESQKKIFQMFYRASVQSFGSGLGLYIVNDAIEKLGGKISLKSQEGKGSTLKIWLPNNND